MYALPDDSEQALFDLTFDRERRREQQGYATPAQARAFLEMARRPTAKAVGAPDPIAAAYFRALDEHVRESPPARVALPPGRETEAAAIVEVLLDSGILDAPQRALPGASQEDAPRLGRIHAAMRFVVVRDPDLYARRSAELGYLANTLLSGCSMQGRAFTPPEASDAAVAVCNLGLEAWPGPVADDVLVTHGLVAVFQRGWSALYERVSLRAARGVLDALTRMRSRDRETQISLNRLRVELTKHADAGMPWRARAALEPIASLDLLAWTALSGLFDECPVQHAAIWALRAKAHAVSPTAFEFISENAQIEAIDEFLTNFDQLL